MKKIICLIIATVLCLTMFTGCEKVGDAFESVGIKVNDATGRALNSAIDSLCKSHEDLAGTHSEDFDVLGSVTVNGAKYAVTWTADSDLVTIRDSVKLGKYTVDLPSNNAEEFKFTLTASVFSESGKRTRSATFEITVPSASAANTISVSEAIDLGKAQGYGKYTTDKYYVSGTVGEFYGDSGTTWGNFYLIGDDGKQILVYGLYDVTGEVRYDAMTTKPQTGDKITVYGVVGNYNGSAQLKNAWLTAMGGTSLGTPSDSNNTGNNSGSTGNGGTTDTNAAATITFEVANRVSWDANSQVWQQNGITVTNEKGASTSNVADYENPARFYSGSKLTIEYNNMVKIVAVCQYADKLIESASDISGATFTTDDKTVTITLDSPVNSFTIDKLAHQAKVYSISVYTGTGSGNTGNTGNTGTGDSGNTGTGSGNTGTGDSGNSGNTGNTGSTVTSLSSLNLSFTGLENKASADSYMQSNFPNWTITGKLGNGYADYLGFGRSGDATSSITSPNFSTSSAFTVSAVLKANPGDDAFTSSLTFTLVDANGNVVATGYAEGSSTAAIVPATSDTTYNISFTFESGKTWTDVSNLVVSFAKSSGNIGMYSLTFNQ